MTVSKKLFVNEDHFKELKPKLQRDFTDFILDTGCDYFPHSRQVSQVQLHSPDGKGGVISGEIKETVNDWWELRLDELDMTMMQVKFPDVFIIRKIEDYENDTTQLNELDDMLKQRLAQGPIESDFVCARNDWEFRNERPLADMLKTYVTNADLYDLADKENESFIMNKLKK